VDIRPVKAQTPAEMLETVGAQMERHPQYVEFVRVCRMWKTSMASRFAEPTRQVQAPCVRGISAKSAAPIFGCVVKLRKSDWECNW
jgi:hypothetical protein